MLTVADSAVHLLALGQGALALAGATQLNAAATVNEAGFTTLHDVMHTATGGYVLTVSDNAANLLALAGDLPPATVTSLSADATLSASQATTLVSEPNFSTGMHVLTVADTASNLLALAPNVLTFAGATQLTAAAIVNIADFATLRDVLHTATGGYTLTISDTAANLVSIAAADLSLATACVLSADGSLSAADAQTLALEPGFATGGHALTISDNVANLLALPTGLQFQAATLALGADQSVSASQLNALATLGTKFNEADHVLTVVDSAVHLLALGQGALALAGATQLNAAATVNAAGFATLHDVMHTATGGYVLTVSDNAANLMALAGDLPPGTNTVLSADATVSALQVATLVSAPNFSTGNPCPDDRRYRRQPARSGTECADLRRGHATDRGGDRQHHRFRHVARRPAHRPRRLHGHDQRHRREPRFDRRRQSGARDRVRHVGGRKPVRRGRADARPGARLRPRADDFGQRRKPAGPASGLQFQAATLALGADQTISASQLNALAALGVKFDAAHHVLTVADSAVHLLALGQGALALAGATELNAAATVNAAGFATLHDVMHTATGGYVLTVSDNAANLLALAGDLRRRPSHHCRPTPRCPRRRRRLWCPSRISPRAASC
ncbi:MAG: hypothetical protein WDN04_09170 [Rhodospirillales bacterium]